MIYFGVKLEHLLSLVLFVREGKKEEDTRNILEKLLMNSIQSYINIELGK